MTEGRSLLLFISIFSTFEYLLYLMSVGSHCAWMKGEAQGSMLCQLGVSFLPAGFCIPPSRCKSHPFLWLQLKPCKVPSPPFSCSPALTPLECWIRQQTRMGACSLRDSLPPPFRLCEPGWKGLATPCLSFPYEMENTEETNPPAVVVGSRGTTCVESGRTWNFINDFIKDAQQFSCHT